MHSAESAERDSTALNKPLYEKVITITGKGIARPANLKVRIGTRLSDIVSYLGGTKPDLARIVMGGPMMGMSQYTLDVPVIKGAELPLLNTQREQEAREKLYGSYLGWHGSFNPDAPDPKETWPPPGGYPKRKVRPGRASDRDQQEKRPQLNAALPNHFCDCREIVQHMARHGRVNLRFQTEQ